MSVFAFRLLSPQRHTDCLLSLAQEKEHFHRLVRHMEGNKVTMLGVGVCRLVFPWALAGTFIVVTLTWHSAHYTLVVVLTLVLDGMSVPVCRNASLQFHAELSELVVMIDTSERTAESGNEKDRDVGGTALLISSVFMYPRPEDFNGSLQQQCFSPDADCCLEPCCALAERGWSLIPTWVALVSDL